MEPEGSENTPVEDLEIREHRGKQFNFYGSVGLLAFALMYFIAGLQIKKLSTSKWYESPNLFPVIIGGVLLVCCLLYMLQNLSGRIISAEDRKNIVRYLKSGVFIRLIIAVGLLAFYIFVLLRMRIGSFDFPYEAATFIYLFANMLIFRTKNYAIWKIFLIAVVVSLAVSFCFSQGAKIPLP